MTTAPESSKWKAAASRVFATVPRRCDADTAKVTIRSADVAKASAHAGRPYQRESVDFRDLLA
jgi:hypothetical protein